MDPVSVELLLAVVGGVGGAVGTEAWQGLVALVKRPFAHSAENEAMAASGLGALAALQQESGNRVAAAELASVLQARAEADADFGDALQAWLDRVRGAFPAGAGDTHNEIRGGTQRGHVLMGRDFSSITLGASGNGSTVRGAIPAGAGDTHNEIRSGTQYRHVLMGRDFSSITLGIGDNDHAAYPAGSD